MEQEMASKLEKDQIGVDKSSTNSLKESIKTEEIQNEVENVGDNEELREEYDQYNDDPSYDNQQREYYNQRFGGLRNRRVLETHSRSLEEKPYYREDSLEQDWSYDQGHHRRLPQTPRRPSTLLNYQPSLLNQQNIQQHNLQTSGQPQQPQQTTQRSTQSTSSIFDKVSSLKQNLLPNLTPNLGGSLPAGTPLSFGVNSNLTVKSERNERDQFTRSGVNPNFVSSLMNGHAQQNGTYSSHPNLQTQQSQSLQQQQQQQQAKQHRQLPQVPKKPSALKLNMWRQSSLPEQRNPPGLDHDIPVIPPFQSSERHPHRRLKPVTPTKPSTLSLRQSANHNMINGTQSRSQYGSFPYQLPSLNCSPSTRTDTMVHYNGVSGSHSQHRTLPPPPGLGRSLPLPPPPPPAPHSPTNKHNGFNGLHGMFHRDSQDVDWI